jgi:hypothetical protein
MLELNTKTFISSIENKMENIIISFITGGFSGFLTQWLLNRAKVVGVIKLVENFVSFRIVNIGKRSARNIRLKLIKFDSINKKDILGKQSYFEHGIVFILPNESVEILIGSTMELKEFECVIRSGRFGRQKVAFSIKNVEHNVFLHSKETELARSLERIASNTDNLRNIEHRLEDITTLKGKQKVLRKKADGSFDTDKDGHFIYDEVDFG